MFLFTDNSTKINKTSLGFNSCLMEIKKLNKNNVTFFTRQKQFFSTWFWFLLRLPQPSHAISLLSSLYIGFLFYPRECVVAGGPSTVTTLLYVACFAMHFGTQFWMTFASGLVLFYRLPRHTFGQVQRVLFPKYFTLNSALSAIILAIFILYHPLSVHSELKIQTFTLLICFVSELGARIYIVPGLLDSLAQRMEVEASAGVGMEIGCHKPGRLALCPRYRRINNRFRLYHAACAVANVIAMFCSVLHLYFLSMRLRPALT